MRIKLENWFAGFDELGREIPASTPAHFLYTLRGIRDVMLRESDWTQMADVPFTDSEKQAWVEFRQMLRNLPSQYTIATITETIEIINPPANAPANWHTLTPEYFVERQAQIEAIDRAIVESGHAALDHTGADHTH